MDYIISVIFLYGWVYILAFIPIFLIYLPVLSLRVSFRKKRNEKDIKFKQILIELISLVILFGTVISLQYY